MIELIITNNEEGQRLNKYLMKYLNLAPSSFIYKMLRKKNIVLNDVKAKGDEIISAGDKLKLFLSDETIAKFREQPGNKVNAPIDTKSLSSNTGKKASANPVELTVLYQDDNIMAVHKPVGVLSQKAKPADYSINEMIIDYLTDNNIIDSTVRQTFKPSVCNRLDCNTSGIILAGISLKGSQQLSRILKDRTADKFYFTIVKGNFKSKKHSIAYIKKNDSGNISTVIDDKTFNSKYKDDKSYSRIETEFVPLSYSNGYTLLKVKLITGKSHQIRAHLSRLGFPIIGDTKYGDRATNQYMQKQYKLKNQLLHAGVVTLPDKTHITDPLPKQFESICIGLGINYENVIC